MKTIASKAISRRLFAVLAAGALAFGLFGLAGCADKADESEKGGEAQITVTMEVDTAVQEGGSVESVDVAVAEGATVLEVLEASDVEYVAEDSSYGKYVTTIAGVEQGSNSGWVYSINGESGMESAEVAVVADGDTITWQFITF